MDAIVVSDVARVVNTLVVCDEGMELAVEDKTRVVAAVVDRMVVNTDESTVSQNKPPYPGSHEQFTDIVSVTQRFSKHSATDASKFRDVPGDSDPAQEITHVVVVHVPSLASSQHSASSLHPLSELHAAISALHCVVQGGAATMISSQSNEFGPHGLGSSEHRSRESGVVVGTGVVLKHTAV